MESIKIAATTASNLVFGDKADQPTHEPVSGQTGPGTYDQPYDQGNQEDNPLPTDTSAASRTVDGSKNNPLPVDTSATGLTAGGSKDTANDNPLTTDTPTAGHAADGRSKDAANGAAGSTYESTNAFPSYNPLPTGISAADHAVGDPKDTTNDNSLLTSTSAASHTADNRPEDTTNSATGPYTTAVQGSGGQGNENYSPVDSESQPVKTAIASMHSGDPRGNNAHTTERDEERKSTTIGGFGTAEPSVGVDPASGQSHKQKHQGADRPATVPNEEESEAIRVKKEEGERTLSQEEKDREREKKTRPEDFPRDPSDHSGEPMKFHGPTKAERRASVVGQEGGGEHGKEKGTGEKWVKTTGFAADGGNFDATKPGAAREANRLLEEKGIHLGGKERPEEAADSHARGGKMGTLHRIKEKLTGGDKSHSSKK